MLQNYHACALYYKYVNIEITLLLYLYVFFYKEAAG